MHHSSKPKMDVEAEDVAVPEVHTGEVDETYLEKPDPGEDEGEEIRYDDVAIPEVHIRRMEHREEQKP